MFIHEHIFCIFLHFWNLTSKGYIFSWNFQKPFNFFSLSPRFSSNTSSWILSFFYCKSWNFFDILNRGRCLVKYGLAHHRSLLIDSLVVEQPVGYPIHQDSFYWYLNIVHRHFQSFHWQLCFSKLQKRFVDSRLLCNPVKKKEIFPVNYKILAFNIWQKTCLEFS